MTEPTPEIVATYKKLMVEHWIAENPEKAKQMAQMIYLNAWLREEAYRLKGDRRWYFWTLKRIRIMNESAISSRPM